MKITFVDKLWNYVLSHTKQSSDIQSILMTGINIPHCRVVEYADMMGMSSNKDKDSDVKVRYRDLSFYQKHPNVYHNSCMEFDTAVHNLDWKAKMPVPGTGVPG